MAKITDKANISDGTEMTVSLAGSTVTLNVAGNLSSGSSNGVTGAALFGALHDLWKSGSTHNRYQFPFAMADGPTGTMLELREGWEFADSASVALVRDCGIAYRNTSGTITASWACFVQLGALADNAHQPYYMIDSATTPSDFGVADEFNECIQIYGDASHGNFDYTGASYAQFFSREAGYTYGGYDLVDEQSLSGLTYRAYYVPLETAADAQVSVTGPSGAPYSGMTLTLGATTNTINSTSYDFAVGEIDANSGTVQQVYDWFQNLLLSTSDIDSGAGTQRGDVYLGASLTKAGGVITTSQGLTIKNIASADASNIVHVDDTGTGRQQAVSASGEVSGMPTAAGADTRLQVYNTTAAASSAWVGTTAYTEGDRVLRTTGAGSESTAGLYFQCSTAGTSGGTEPTWDTTPGNTTNDGTVVWTCYALLAYDDDPASATYSVSYTDGEDYASGDSLNVRFAELDADSTFKTFEQNVTVGSTGWAVTCDEEADSVYATNGVDGSGVTKFSADTSSSQINLVVAANFTAAEAYAFYCYQLTTSAGMRAFWGGVTAIDVGNYRINTSVLMLYLDNETTATQRQTDTARIFRDDEAYPVLDPTTSGYGIDINWKNVVYVVTAGSGLTAGQAVELTNAATYSASASTNASTAATAAGAAETAADTAASNASTAASNAATAASNAATAASSAATAATQSTIARKLLQNRQHTDDETGKLLVYDDADSAVEYEATLWDDDEGSTAWDGTNAIKRRDRLDTPA